MAIAFKSGRMLVGHHREDWSEVWYEPMFADSPNQTTLDNDVYVNVSLYNSPSGPSQSHDPMEGQVRWFAQFDWRNCESDTNQEKRGLQRRTLYRAWNYLNEKDAQQVRQLEEDYDRPAATRWQSWFVLAKKFKATKQRERTYRVVRRLKELKKNNPDPNLSYADIDIPSDTSEDETYESDEDVDVRRVLREREQRHGSARGGGGRGGGRGGGGSGRMQPPPKPKATPRKRGNNGGTASGSKRSRPSARGKGKVADRADSPLSDYNMSGGISGLGGRASPGIFVGSEFNIPGLDDEDEDYDNVLSRSSRENSLWDGRSPERGLSPARTSRDAAARRHLGKPLHSNPQTETRIMGSVEDANADPYEARALAENGGEASEEAAMQRAIRESMPPEHRPRANGAAENGTGENATDENGTAGNQG